MTTGHCESSLGSFDELQNSAQAAVDPQTKPPDLGCESACRQLSSATTIRYFTQHTLHVKFGCSRPRAARNHINERRTRRSAPANRSRVSIRGRSCKISSHLAWSPCTNWLLFPALCARM